MVNLLIFIMGDPRRMDDQLVLLKEAFRKRGVSECSVEIINLLDEPEMADRYKVFATPTLLKRSPAPSVKVIGDLASHEKILDVLGVDR